MLLQGDGKMSKSKGNVIYADELVDFFGVDAVRYFVLHEMPFENDGVITWELMVERLNSELANTLGNLVNRTISMSNKYFGGVVENKGVTEPVDDDLKNFILSVPAKVNEKMDKLRVADAMTEVFTIFKRCNKYIDETMPWALAKDEEKKDRLATVLYNLVEGICIGASLLKSFMPRTTERILVQLNANERTLEEMDQFGLYPSGNRVTDKPEILFARLDLKEVLEKVEKLHPKKEEPKEEVEEEKTEDVIDIEAKPETLSMILRSCSSRLVRSSPVRRLRNPENFSALRLRSEAMFVRSYPESRLIIPQRKWLAKRLWSLQT